MMNILYYYGTEKLELADIQECASQADYKTTIQTDVVLKSLGLFVLQDVGKGTAFETTIYWRWEKLNVDWSNIESEEQDVVAPIWSEVQSIFAVGYSMGYLKQLGQMMLEIFRCHGGCIAFEGTLFNNDNILTISEYLPPPTPGLPY